MNFKVVHVFEISLVTYRRFGFRGERGYMGYGVKWDNALVYILTWLKSIFFKITRQIRT